MGSHGGVATAQAVAERPIMTLMSGPAAGVLGGAWAGALSGRDRLITFDVGGDERRHRHRHRRRATDGPWARHMDRGLPGSRADA